MQAPERPDIPDIGDFSDAVFGVVAAFLADDHRRFVAEVEVVELVTWLRARPKAPVSK